MEEDLVSIVVPVYNVENYLNKCLDTIIEQTYKNIEIIIVNDGSPDNSLKICEDYKAKDNRIIIISKENGGLSDARNKGIEIAKGKYITFIDSDDYIDSDFISTMVNDIEKNNSDISIISHKVIYPNTIIDKSTKEEFVSNKETILERMLYDHGIDVSAWAKLYKTSLFEDIRYPVGRLYEDSATTYKLIDKAKVISVKSLPLYNYMVRENSIANNEFNEKKMDLITSTEEMTDFIRDKYPSMSKGCNRRMVYAYLSTLTQLARSSTRNKEIENMLISYIKKNGKKVFWDTKTPKRDKFGIFCSFCGFSFYKFAWNLYTRKNNRRVK